MTLDASGYGAVVDGVGKLSCTNYLMGEQLMLNCAARYACLNVRMKCRSIHGIATYPDIGRFSGDLVQVVQRVKEEFVPRHISGPVGPAIQLKGQGDMRRGDFWNV